MLSTKMCGSTHGSNPNRDGSSSDFTGDYFSSEKELNETYNVNKVFNAVFSREKHIRSELNTNLNITNPRIIFQIRLTQNQRPRTL